MSVDRSKAPQFSLPTEFALPAPQQFKLGSGSPVFYFPTPGIDAVKLEVIGNSSRSLLPNSHALIPSFTLQMLQEGTTKLTLTKLEFKSYLADFVQNNTRKDERVLARNQVHQEVVYS